MPITVYVAIAASVLIAIALIAQLGALAVAIVTLHGRAALRCASRATLLVAAATLVALYLGSTAAAVLPELG